MATVPLSGTNVRLLSDVPFSNDYKNTRWFDNLNDQTNYFLNKPCIWSMNEATFQRIEGRTFISLNAPIDSLWNVNYVMFQNASYNHKWFYGFVTKLEYVQKHTTYVHFEIDVFQTWKFEMNFKPSYVVREHAPEWEADGTTPIINTIDEGLFYGSEYDNVYVEQIQANNGYKWLVIVAKNPMHNGASTSVTPTVIGTPQPLSYYLVPFLDDDRVPNVYIESTGIGVLISKPTQVLTNLYKDSNAVNNIVSLYVTDYTGLSVTITAGNPDTINFPNNGNILQPAQITDGGSSFFNCLYVQKALTFQGSIVSSQQPKYYGYTPPEHSKMLMYPYTLLVLDDFRGNRQVFKNEYIYSPNINIVFKGGLGTSNNVTYGIDDYNFAFDNSFSPFPKDKVSDENALINNNPNDVPILTDLLAAYLQGNKNSLQNQKNSLLFNGATDVISNSLGAVMNTMMMGPIGGAQGATQVVKGAGNTVLQLQGMQAKQKDIANIPPQIAKMGSNTAYSFGNSFNGVYLIKKQIKPEYFKKISDFLLMYGYKKNEVKVPNFHTRASWNYVQTSSCIITGNFGNEDLVELKSVFDQGITLWHTDDIGNYSLDNRVIA
jgi:hypothetical protein